MLAREVDLQNELLYLPSYSPDYNPIEEAFAKINDLLRKAAARTKEALVEAIGVALSAVSSQGARGFFEHAGYRPTAQLPSNGLSQLPCDWHNWAYEPPEIGSITLS